MPDTFQSLLLAAPDAQLDKSLRPILERWDEDPTALQVLELLDACIHWGAASGFMVSVLQTMLNAKMASEGVILEQLLPLATWRKV